MPTNMPPRPLLRRPTVSVVVPCYRYGHYLPGAVRSVLDQTDVDAEVLIVDDASPDDSGEVAEALAAADPRIRVLRHAENKGHIATYNDGLEAVDGEYVVLLSADDLLPPGSLGRATALMEANPSVGMVYGHPLRLPRQPTAGDHRGAELVDLGRPRVDRATVPARQQLHLQPRGRHAGRGAARRRRLRPRPAPLRGPRDVAAGRRYGGHRSGQRVHPGLLPHPPGQHAEDRVLHLPRRLRRPPRRLRRRAERARKPCSHATRRSASTA